MLLSLKNVTCSKNYNRAISMRKYSARKILAAEEFKCKPIDLGSVSRTVTA
jgi:hypothetical protein